MDPLLDAELQVAHDDIGGGEVDDELRAVGQQVADRVLRIDRRNEVHVLGRLDCLADLPAHLSASTQDPDLQHVSHLPNLVEGRRFSLPRRPTPSPLVRTPPPPPTALRAGPNRPSFRVAVEGHLTVFPQVAYIFDNCRWAAVASFYGGPRRRRADAGGRAGAPGALVR